jgi:hypothetical protein
MFVGRSHFLAPNSSGGEVHHQDPLCIECGLMRLGHGSSLLASELALLLHHLTLDVGLLSAGSRSLALSKSMSSLKGEADVLPQCARPRWNHHYGLSGQIVL